MHIGSMLSMLKQQIYNQHWINYINLTQKGGQFTVAGMLKTCCIEMPGRCCKEKIKMRPKKAVSATPPRMQEKC